MWRGTDKVTRLSTINEYEKGGLKMIDLQSWTIVLGHFVFLRYFLPVLTNYPCFSPSTPPPFPQTMLNPRGQSAAYITTLYGRGERRGLSVKNIIFVVDNCNCHVTIIVIDHDCLNFNKKKLLFLSIPAVENTKRAR